MHKEVVRLPGKICIAIFLLSLTVLSLPAADIVWTNTFGGSWTVTNNWSPNTVPTNSDTAWITNAGTFGVTNTVTTSIGSLVLGGVSGVKTLRLTAGTLTITNTTASSNGVIALSGGSFTSGGQFDSAGELQENNAASILRLVSTATLNRYNFTNGVLRGGTLWVTNFNWAGGDVYADANGDKTIIPPGGVLNFATTATRTMSYNAPATAGRGLDNYGTWNWTESSILYALQTGCVVNNYGTVNVSNASTGYFTYNTGYSAPVWNNLGTFNKTGAGIFYFQQVNLSNAGALYPSGGTLSLFQSTLTNSGTIAVSNATLQAYASACTNTAILTLDANSSFTVDNSGTFVCEAASSLVSPGANRIVVNAGTLILRSTNVVSPSALIAGGTLWHQTNNTFNTINENAGAWRLSTTNFVNNYNLTNGSLRGGTLWVTNFTWLNGDLYADANGDKTIIPTNGVLNFLTTGARILHYNAPATYGRGLDNYGVWNWTDNSVLYGLNTGATVNNYGTVNVSNTGIAYYTYYSPSYTAPTWNNYGTFNKAGTGTFYFQQIYLGNSGAFNPSAGTLSFHTSTVNNSGSIAVTNATLQAYASTCTNNGPITLDANSFFTLDNGGTFTCEAPSSLSSPAVNHLVLNSGTLILRSTNVVSPTVLIAGGTLWHQTNNTFNTINENAGAWRLSATTYVNNYNLTNGALRGGTLWVTNFNWMGGDLYADANGDRTIIPTNGVLNFTTTASRILNYNAPATYGRGLDNLGVWNWSGDSVLYGLHTGCVVNNNGVINVTNSGVAYFTYYTGYTGPTFNNGGSIVKRVGTNTFYFQGCYLNNSSVIDIQSGTLDVYASTFTNNAPLFVQAGAYFVNDGGSSSVSTPFGQIFSAAANHFMVTSGNFYLQSTNVSAPSFLINGGTLWQQAENRVPVINQTAGAWRLTVATAVDTYNLTNGELRGGTLTVTNFNWYNGNLNADLNGDKTIIPVGGVLNFPGTATRYMSYNNPATFGRGLDLYGTMNWTGDSVLVGVGTQTVNNYGAVYVTGTGNMQFSYNTGYPAPTWNNYGTITKSGGTNVINFTGCYLNNYNLLDIQAGYFTPYASSFTNYGTLNLTTNANFWCQNNSAIVLASNSVVNVPGVDRMQVQSGNVYLLTTNVTAPTILINGGTLWQQADNRVPIINQSSGTWRLTVTTAVDTYNFTNGELRGGILTVTNLNWINGNLNADANSDKTIIPVGGVLNFPGTATRYMSYNAGASLGRGLDIYGTMNWSGDSVLVGVGAQTVNSYGTVNVTGTGNMQYSYNSGYPSPTWNNYGTFLKTNGAATLNFTGCYLNNYNLLNIQSGYFVPYASAFSNYATLNLSAAASFYLQNNSAATLVSNSVTVSPGVDHIQVQSGSLYLLSTNLVTPTLLINGGTVWQHVPNVVQVINQSSGTWRHTINTAVDTYNFTNGELRGGILTVTNLNWINGNMNADANTDKTIIPVGGVLNYPNSNTRYMSYNAGATLGRGLDIYGTMNWTGDSLLVGVGAQTVNNYGTVNVTGLGNQQFCYNSGYPAPTWNNYGTFSKTTGAGVFNFNGCYLNNQVAGQLNFDSGIFAPYGSTVTNLGAISLAGTATLENNNNTGMHLQPGSSLTGASVNALRVNSGVVYLRTPNVAMPSLLIAGGTLQQETNCAVTVINESLGTWLPTVPISLNTYNLTNGDLRGADVTLANFNWLGGGLYSTRIGGITNQGTNITVTGVLNISGSTAKSISYINAEPSRTLINNGTALWSGVGISGTGAASFRNNSSLTLSNDVGFANGGGTVPSFINNGTVSKISGTGASAFTSTTVTNAGTMLFTNGSFSCGSLYQTAGTVHLGTNFSVAGNVRVDAGTFTGRGGVSGWFYNNGIANPGASPGLITAATWTNTSAATVNLELAGTNAPGTNYDQLRLTGNAVLDGNLNVSLANNFAPQLGNSFTAMVFTARSGTYANIIPPPGVGLTATYSTTNLVLNVTTLTNVPLQVTTFPTNVGVWTPDGASFSVGVSGTTPISYQWAFNGTNISGATNATYALASTVVANAGTYSVLVTDGAAATTNVSATLAVTQFTGLITWTNVAGGNWSLASNWSPARVPNATNTAIITNAGTYTVSVDADASVSNLVVGLNGVTNVSYTLSVYPASLTVGSNATFATNATLALASTYVNNGLALVDGNFNFDGGALAGPGRWLLGTNAVTTLRTGGYKYLAGGYVENFGAFGFDGSEYRGLTLVSSTTFTNQPGGSLSLGYSGFNLQSGATNATLVNRGLISAPGNPSTIYVPFFNATNGTLSVGSSCYIGTGTNRGTLQVNHPLAGLAFVGGNFNLETGSTLLGAGTIGANFSGVLNFNTPITCSNQIVATGGAASPIINVNANLTNSSVVSVAKGDINVAPGVVLDAANVSVSWAYQTYTHSSFNNGGTIYADTLAQAYGNLVNSNQIIVRGAFNWNGGNYYNAAPANKLTTLSNAVTSINTSSTYIGKSFSGGLWENFGTVNFVSPYYYPITFGGGAGWINRSNAVINAYGDTLVANADGTAWLANYGLVQRTGFASAPGLGLITTNYNLVSLIGTIVGLGDYTQISGKTDIGGSEIRGGQLKILGGEIVGAASLTSGATLYNAATLRPGSTIGTMDSLAAFTNTASGVFHLEIAGNLASQYDSVRVAGPVQLAGTLNLILTNSFVPTVGNTYTAMTYTARSGQFTSVVMPGYDFEVIYLTNMLILKSSNALPVVNFTVAGGSSTQLVCNPFKFAASASDLDGFITNLTVKLDTTTVSSNAGAAINATAELDFPGTVNFVATAIDDHGGARSVTQALQLVTLPLHLLTLGGQRTNSFKVCMLGQPGSNYVLYATTNFDVPFTNWANLGLMQNTNGIWRYTDPGTITNRQFRYYKAKQQ